MELVPYTVGTFLTILIFIQLAPQARLESDAGLRQFGGCPSDIVSAPTVHKWVTLRIYSGRIYRSTHIVI